MASELESKYPVVRKKTDKDVRELLEQSMKGNKEDLFRHIEENLDIDANEVKDIVQYLTEASNSVAQESQNFLKKQETMKAMKNIRLKPHEKLKFVKEDRTKSLVKNAKKLVKNIEAYEIGQASH